MKPLNFIFACLFLLPALQSKAEAAPKLPVECPYYDPDYYEPGGWVCDGAIQRVRHPAGQGQSSQSIPTLGEWGLLLLCLAMGGVGVAMTKRKL